MDDVLSEQTEQHYSLRVHDEKKPHLTQYKNFIDNYTIRQQDIFRGVESGYNPIVTFPYISKESSTPIYLKAHGSIDWYACTNNMCRASTSLFLVEDPSKIYYCSECHEQMTNVLVPPVLNKQLYLYPSIRKVWNTAAREMAAASEVIVWGYSLPPTDFYSNWLMRRARTDRLEKLVIINPDVVSKTRRGFSDTRASVAYGFVRKIYDIYRGIIDKENIYLYESMKDYSRNREIRKKYPELRKSTKDPYKKI